jgi:predicted Zn-dependent peptidase
LSERYFQHTFANGLTLLAEQVAGVKSAAMTLLLAAGSATDPPGAQGCSAVLSDLILRGAGDRDVRQLSDYLDSLGLHRSSSVGVYHTRLGCQAVAARVIEALPVYADIVRRPHLPQQGFDAARDLALQSLQGLEDDPRQKLLVNLREWFLRPPLGKNPMGTIADLQALTLQTCRDHWRSKFQAAESILAIAGDIDFAEIKGEIEKYFGDFAGRKVPPIKLGKVPGRYHHENQKSEQTHIGIAYPSVPEIDPDYYAVRIAAEVLGGGMSGRLFTEVREKRGLCYSVWAGYTGLKGIGAMMAYAGTSNERAQATLDCTLEQIALMARGITQAELDRAKIALKASLIMDGESTSARAGSIAHDFFMRGKIRTLDEISAHIDAVDLARINGYLAGRNSEQFTIVVVGPRELKTPVS